MPPSPITQPPLPAAHFHEHCILEGVQNTTSLNNCGDQLFSHVERLVDLYVYVIFLSHMFSHDP